MLGAGFGRTHARAVNWAAMTQHAKIPLGRFYKTPPLPCPYLSGRSERKVFTELAASGPGAQAMHEVLAAAGFRRSHSIVYKPHCDGCSACVPVRVRARAFRPNRTMRRVLRHNAGVVARTLPAVARSEHFELFRHYQETRHSDSDMALMDFAEFARWWKTVPSIPSSWSIGRPAIGWLASASPIGYATGCRWSTAFSIRRRSAPAPERQ